MIVTEVAPGSPAEQAGLYDGDHIVQIAGHDITTLSYPDCRELIRTAGAAKQKNSARDAGTMTSTPTGSGSMQVQ